MTIFGKQAKYQTIFISTIAVIFASLHDPRVENPTQSAGSHHTITTVSLQAVSAVHTAPSHHHNSQSTSCLCCPHSSITPSQQSVYKLSLLSTELHHTITTVSLQAVSAVHRAPSHHHDSQSTSCLCCPHSSITPSQRSVYKLFLMSTELHHTPSHHHNSQSTSCL